MANSVWTAAERAEITRRQGLRTLYEGDHETYYVKPTGEEQRYESVIVNWLGDVLSQTWKRLLFREFPAIGTRDENRQVELDELVTALDLPGISPMTALQVSWAGRAVWKLYYSRLSGAPVAELWEKNDGEVALFDYLPTDKSKPIAVNFWYSVVVAEEDGSKDETYWVRERHELLVNTETGAVGGVRMTNTAYKSEGGVPIDEEVDLAEIWPDEGSRPEAEVDTPGLTLLPAVMITNPDRNGDGAGDTDYTASLISIQKNIDKLAASRQYVIDISEEPNITVPETTTDEEGNLDWRKVKLRIKYPGEGAGETIDISSWTGNLENSQAQWENYRQEFRALSGIAPALFGEVDGTGGESGYAKRLGLVPTESEVGARREPWTKAYRAVIALATQMMRVYGGQQVEDFGDIGVNWPKAIPEDSTEVSQTTTQEYREGTRSLVSAVRRQNPDWTEDQVAEEVGAIEAEAAKKRALSVPDANNPFGRIE